MTRPEITIVVPIYNGAAYLKETLESLLAQTFTNFELLAIDDGSTDSSTEIVRSLKDERIRLICLDRGGLCATLNRGMSEARAPYFARSDHDDISFPTRLERQLKVMKNHPDAIAVFSFNSKFGKKHRWANSDKFSVESSPVREYSPERDGCMLASTMLARTESLGAMGGFRQAYWPCDDIDLQFRMSEAGKVMILCEPLVDYRFHVGAYSYPQFQRMQLLADWARDSRYRRMRNEPEITYDEFLKNLPADRWSRLRRHRIFSSREHMRVGGQRYLDGQYLASAAHFSMSALLDPGDISRRIKRLVRRFV